MGLHRKLSGGLGILKPTLTTRAKIENVVKAASEWKWPLSNDAAGETCEDSVICRKSEKNNYQTMFCIIKVVLIIAGL